MSATNAVETDVLELVFQAVTWPDFAEDDTTSPLTALFVSLHTADPTETGTQTSSEATYTSYARQSVARTTGGWAVSGNTVDNVAAVTFPEATGGSETITHFGIGQNTSGAGNLYFSGALDSTLAVSTNVQPEFAIGALNITLD